ncbi:MAG: D-glycero-beta-D-manno-heptose 1-phosphate adenylyltransferase [Bacteroidota bacterium]|nr:D-glycero-beta-D-manno-heptose 1-phosphate adenylyltransferase [Bacteroidota bacterium]
MSKHLKVEDKIFDLPGIKTQVDLWNAQGKKIVFTNGCFDILHRGHVDYLAKAADLGDVLVLGLNSDASVGRLKGPNRPIQDELSRLHIIASLAFVDAVVLFDEPTPLALIELVQPDILVKGSDYKPEDIVGYDIVTAKGGSVKTIDFIEGYSSSLIIKKIKEN